MDEIINTFYECKKIGWIKNVGHGYSSVGRTFEAMLGIKENSNPEADLNGIEIKTKTSKIHSSITLFSCSPFNYLDLETFRITLGKDDKNLKNSKVLFLSVSNSKNMIVNNQYYLQIEIDESFGVVSINVYRIEDNKLLVNVFWIFEQLDQRIKEKCQNLVFISADKLTKNGNIYFKYKNLSYYKLKSTETFYNLIKQGVISIVFNIGVYKSGVNIGKPYIHGINFSILEKNLELLYNKIFEIK